jgi:hypothetical protein
MHGQQNIKKQIGGFWVGIKFVIILSHIKILLKGIKISQNALVLIHFVRLNVFYLT